MRQRAMPQRDAMRLMGETRQVTYRPTMTRALVLVMITIGCSAPEEDLDVLAARHCAEQDAIVLPRTEPGTVGSPCDAPTVCDSGFCSSGLCTSSCSSDADCPTWMPTCAAGVCSDERGCDYGLPDAACVADYGAMIARWRNTACEAALRDLLACRQDRGPFCTRAEQDAACRTAVLAFEGCVDMF